MSDLELFFSIFILAPGVNGLNEARSHCCIFILYLFIQGNFTGKSQDFEIMLVAMMARPQCYRVPYMPGSHHYERVTPILSLYHGIFTHLSIFWLLLP